MIKTHRRTAIVTLISLIGTLSGCTPKLSQQQCEQFNWQQMGINDGKQGLAQRNLNSIQQSCSIYSVSVNQSAYQHGWAVGIKQFCTAKNATELADAGKINNPNCHPSQFPAFARAYQRGLKRFCQDKKAYQLGRQGEDYPAACIPSQFPRFANAYNEGKGTYSQISTLQSQLDSLTTQIQQQQSDVSNNKKIISTEKHNIAQARQALTSNSDQLTLTTLQKQIQQHQQHISNLQQQNLRALSAISQMQAEASSLKQQISVNQ